MSQKRRRKNIRPFGGHLTPTRPPKNPPKSKKIKFLKMSHMIYQSTRYLMLISNMPSSDESNETKKEEKDDERNDEGKEFG